MGGIGEALMAYAQPLLDATDGSSEQMQRAMSIAQVCWNIAVLPEEGQRDALEHILPALNISEDKLEDFCAKLLLPMIARHREMFPELHHMRSENVGLTKRNEKFSSTGRNEPCPCGSGKKYKKCCG